MRKLTPMLLVPVLWLGAACAADEPATTMDTDVALTEWDVPWENTRPRDPYVAPDGRVWFVGQAGHYVGYLDPNTGELDRLPLDDGTGPHNLIVDDDGTIWYAGNRAAHIGKMDPETGEIHKIMMPDEAARDPHTLVFDSQGDIWFSVQGGNFVGKLDTETEEVQLVEVPTERARPYGIVVDSNDRPWFTLFGTNKLGTVDPATMELREYELPREGTRPRRLVATSDDILWYVDFAEGHLGRLDPASGDVREWALPGGEDARPYGMAVDDRDRIWFVESGLDPNMFVGFDPATEEFFEREAIESGGGTVRHMYYHAPTRTVWFGTDAHTIGRAQVGAPMT